MKFKWDMENFAPDVNRCIWGDDYSPRESESDGYVNVSKPRYQPPERVVERVIYEQAAQHRAVRYEPRAPSEGNTWKNLMFFSISAAILIFTINYFAPEVIPFTIETVKDIVMRLP